jgi:hypothetical protein
MVKMTTINFKELVHLEKDDVLQFKYSCNLNSDEEFLTVEKITLIKNIEFEIEKTEVITW